MVEKIYLYCLTNIIILFVQVICCPHLRFSRHGLFSSKKIKTKGSFIVGLKNFCHYLLGIETEETVSKKIK